MKRRTFLRSTLAAAAVTAVPQRQGLAALYQAVQQVPPDVDAVTGTGRDLTLRGRDIAGLAGRLHGRLLLAGHEGYDQARRILNPSFDKHPALIVQPTGPADVRSAVEFAREHTLLLAVKCGGHSFSGISTCDRGMMIDLSSFRGVRVDPAARKAWVAGGSLLAHVDHEAMSHGLVTPLGTVSHTGVGGLTTGGGFGRVARRFGLASDNLIAVDVVTADGAFVRASAEENEDLFWGVRGGGGNFGIVTAFEFRLHPMRRQVVGGNIMFPLARARDVLNVYAEYASEAPDELYLDLILMSPPGGEPGVAGFSLCYSGPPNGAERALDPIRGLGTPVADDVKAVDYVALQRSGDVTDPRAMGVYIKGGFIPEVTPGLVDALVDGFEGDPRRMTNVFFQHGRGAIGRLPSDATSFSHRYALANMGIVVGWPHGQDPSEHVEWIRSFHASVERFTGGFYTNDMPPGTTPDQVNANYRGNYPRLVQIKNKYDPTNLFRLNANIEPTV